MWSSNSALRSAKRFSWSCPSWVADWLHWLLRYRPGNPDDVARVDTATLLLWCHGAQCVRRLCLANGRPALCAAKRSIGGAAEIVPGSAGQPRRGFRFFRGGFSFSSLRMVLSEDEDEDEELNLQPVLRVQKPLAKIAFVRL